MQERGLAVPGSVDLYGHRRAAVLAPNIAGNERELGRALDKHDNTTAATGWSGGPMRDTCESMRFARAPLRRYTSERPVAYPKQGP